jgi:hypothetical protein
MFSGFFLNGAMHLSFCHPDLDPNLTLLADDSVPVYMAWLKHISFIRYTFQGLVINEFKGQTFDCDLPPAGNATMAPPCANGDDLLAQLNFDDIEIWFVVMMNVIIGCAFHLLAYILLSAR